MNGVHQRGRGATLSPCGSLEATEIVPLDLFRRCDGQPIDMAMVRRRITELSSHRPTCSYGLCSAAASINGAAKRTGINYRTAQRIVEAAAEHRQGQLSAVG